MVDSLGRSLLVVLSTVAGLVRGQADWVIPIEHAIHDAAWSPRGEVRIGRGRDSSAATATFIAADLPPSFEAQLLDAAVKGRHYRVRAPTSMTDERISEADFVWSRTYACRVATSGLSDLLSLGLDSAHSRVLSVALKPFAEPSGPEDDLVVCPKAGLGLLDSLNTTVRIVDVVDGPVPETAAYVQKMEQEREERIRGGDTDNRSFIGKYWMYIVPVVLFLMVSSAMNPEPAAA